MFIIISSFDSELGDPTTALQIASGSLWIWLVPVIWGWITVGTQSSENSIQDALEDGEATQATASDNETDLESPQMGIVIHSRKSDYISTLSLPRKVRSNATSFLS